MNKRHHPITRAALARDAALARLRRFTHALIAGSVALAGIFAGLAAASTHPRKVVNKTARTTQPRQSTTATPQTTTAVPPSDDESSPAASTTTPAAPAAPAPAPPVQAPTPSSSPPVVVSGGS